MFQRSPEAPVSSPPTAETMEMLEQAAQEAIDMRFQKYIQRRNRWIAVGKVAMTAGLFFNAHTAVYLADVRSNMDASADAQPSILKMDQANNPENNDKATIFFHGFNAYGGRDLIRTLGEGYQSAFDSQLWAVQYNNAPLDNNKIGEELISQLELEGIKSVDIFTYSQGDVPGVDVAVDDIMAETSINVENITIVAGPSSFDTLTEKTKDELRTAKSLAWIPWIEYSTPFRLILEAYFYRNAMQSDPIQTSNGIGIRFTNGDMTSNAFLASQINSISDADVSGKIRNIAEYSDEKFRPNVNIITIEGDKDTVVNNVAASEDQIEAAEDADLNVTVLSVDSRHGEFYTPASIEEYNAIFAQLAPIVAPYTSKEAARQALSLYGYYQQDSLLLNKR